MSKIKWFLDIYFPRFMTEDVAFKSIGYYKYEPICSVKDLHPSDTFDAIFKVRAFNLFGLAIFGRIVQEIR